MDFWIRAAQLIASLSILIVFHEMGHFLTARFFKTRVEKFYLFFNPWFSLFKIKRGETEYGIGWLPLGGYVKISGMIDESMDKEQMKLPPKPWEFRSKPTWQRLIIMLGGVTVNVILAMFIYAMVLFTWGDKYLPNENLTDGLWCVDSLMIDMGFQTGDKIITINDQKPEKFTQVLEELLYGGEAKVLRNGQNEIIPIPKNFVEQLTEMKERGTLIAPRIPFIIAEIPDSSINNNSGLLPKDRIVSLAGTPLKYFDEFKNRIGDYKGEQIAVVVERDGVNKKLDLQVSEDGLIGVATAILSYSDMMKMNIYDFKVTEYGFFESFPAGIERAIEKLGSYTRQFKLLLNPSTGAYKGLGGFGAIGSLFPAEWDWEVFWSTTAFISIILAFMNVLPIPALDGGHVMFLLYEMVVRRKPSDKFMEYAQITGFVLLLSLMAYATRNDIVNFLMK